MSSWARILILVTFILVMMVWAIVAKGAEQVQLTPEEFATEVCTHLKDKGLLNIKYNGVVYDCKEYAKEE